MYNFDFEENEKWKKTLELTHAVWKVSNMSLEDQILKNKIKDISNDILIKYTSHISDEEEDGEKDLIALIDSLLALLSLAQKISDLREINFLILKNEYKKIKFSLLARLEAKQLNNKINLHNGTLKEKEEEEEITDEEQEIIPEADAYKENTMIRKVKLERPEPPVKKVKVPKSEPKPKLKKEKTGYMDKSLSQREGMLLNFFKVRKGQQIKLKDVKKLFPKVTDRTIRNDLKALCNKGFIERSERRGQGSFYYLAKI